MGFGVLFGGNDIVFERLRFEAEMRLHRFVHLPPEFRLADLEQVPEVIMVLDELRDALRHSGIIERAQSPRPENAVDRVRLPARAQPYSSMSCCSPVDLCRPSLGASGLLTPLIASAVAKCAIRFWLSFGPKLWSSPCGDAIDMPPTFE